MSTVKEPDIRVLIIAPNHLPRQFVIENKTAALQAWIGSRLETAEFGIPGVRAIYNAEHEILELAPNALFRIGGQDVMIGGTVIVAGAIELESGETVYRSLDNAEVALVLSQWATGE